VARARDTCSVVGEDTVGDVMPSCYGAPASTRNGGGPRPAPTEGVTRTRSLALYWM